MERGKNYDFQVRSVSNCGAKSDWVAAAVVMDGAVILPGPITGISSSSVADGVHLAWTTGPQPSDVEYSIERSPNGTDSWAVRTTVRALSYTDPETSGDTYFYRVRAVNQSGLYGPYSAVVDSNGVSVSAIKTLAETAANNASDARAIVDANAPLVPNGSFKNSDDGWDLGTGWSTDSTLNKATYTGASGRTSEYLTSKTYTPCAPGSLWHAGAVAQSSSLSGTVTVEPRFYDSSKTLISGDGGNTITGTAGPLLLNTVAKAPASTAFVRYALRAVNGTSGTCNVMNCFMDAATQSLDDVPDSSTRFAAVTAEADSTQANADYIATKATVSGLSDDVDGL